MIAISGQDVLCGELLCGEPFCPEIEILLHESSIVWRVRSMRV
jgi:hypothetical protein